MTDKGRCLVEDCERLARTRGLCQPHYDRMKKCTDPAVVKALEAVVLAPTPRGQYERPGRRRRDAEATDQAMRKPKPAAVPLDDAVRDAAASADEDPLGTEDRLAEMPAEITERMRLICLAVLLTGGRIVPTDAGRLLIGPTGRMCLLTDSGALRRIRLEDDGPVELMEAN